VRPAGEVAAAGQPDPGSDSQPNLDFARSLAHFLFNSYQDAELGYAGRVC